MTNPSWMTVDSSLPWEQQTKSDREIARDEFRWWQERRRRYRADPEPPRPQLLFWKPGYVGLVCLDAGDVDGIRYFEDDGYWLWRWVKPNEFTMYELLDMEPDMWPCLCCHKAPCICDEVK